MKNNPNIQPPFTYTETNYTDLIRQWAINRNLHTADPTRQMLKLVEEVGELAHAMARGENAGVIDAIGDIYVVLTILTMQLNLDINACIKQSYNVIKDRKGKLVDGVFIKEDE
jgi:NTP pyrophosphatase (non-canonical NTP hydrolase)